MSRDRIWLFFAVSLAGTGVLHGAIAALDLPFSLEPTSPALALYLAGLAVPAASAIILTERGRRRAFLGSALRPRGDVVTWCGVVLAQLAVLGVAWALALALGGAAGLRFAPSAGFGLLAVGQVWVAFGEELGWRGFALPRLIDRFGPVIATLLLAPIWAVWHAPMFFVANSLQATTSPVLFAASILCWSAMHTEIYRRMRPSALANMAFHACANVTLNLVFVPEANASFVIAAYAVVAAITLAWLGAQKAPASAT